jgi:hypothetical protein
MDIDVVKILSDPIRFRPYGRVGASREARHRRKLCTRLSLQKLIVSELGDGIEEEDMKSVRHMGPTQDRIRKKI